MQVVKAFPPNYEKVIATFPAVEKMHGVVFTYGDIIYYPYQKKAIADHLIVHERTHSRQQGDNPADWWDRYLIDVDFRLSQELEAYRRQYAYYIAKNHNLNDRAWFIDALAGDLSGAMYGNLVTKLEAMEIIKNLWKW